MKKGIERGFHPRFYNIQILLKALEHEELSKIKPVRTKFVEGYDRPIIVLKADSHLLTQLESHYIDLLSLEYRHLERDELRKLFPAQLRSAALS